MKDEWRYQYIGEENWLLDELYNYNPEDEIIDMLDGRIPPPEFKTQETLLSPLKEFPAKVVYEYIWNGKTFKQIGEENNYTKQRIFQIYKQAIEELRKHYKDLTFLYIMKEDQ